MLTSRATGPLFLGKSFGALAGAEPPAFLRHMDNAILAWIMEGMFPLTFRLLQRLPIKSLQEFLSSGDGVYEVLSSSTFSFDFQGRRILSQDRPVFFLATERLCTVSPIDVVGDIY